MRYLLIVALSSALLNCAGEGDALLLTSVGSTSQSLAPADQCTGEEIADWELRMQACTGPWSYATYDCFRLGRTTGCGFSHFEQVPILGTLSCEHPDNEAVRWTLAHSVKRTVTYLQLAGYENFVTTEAKRLFGKQALGVYRIVEGNTGELPKWMSKLGNNAAEVPYTETYYYKVDNDGWALHVVRDLRMPISATLTKQHDVMENAKRNLNEGFGVTTWDASARPTLIYNPRAMLTFTVEEQYYKATRYAVQPNPACGTGPVGWAEDATHPIYNECRDPNNGREKTNVCNAPEQSHTSGWNLRRDELPLQFSYAHDTASCSTGDALGDNASPSALFEAFRSVASGQLGVGHEPLPSGIAPEHARRLATKKLKFAFERYGSSLTLEQRASMPSVYGETTQVNACGTSRGRTGATSRQKELLALVEICHRLSLDHVPTTNTLSFLPACWSPAKHLLSESENQNVLGELGDTGYQMLEKYIGHALEENLPLCDGGASDAAGLIDSWFAAAQSWYQAEEALSLRDRLTELLATQCL